MSTNFISIFVDADACPVKAEVERVANRHKIKTYIVSNGGIRPSQNPLLNLVVVSKESDAADIWISENMSENDIVVTSDIVLAATALTKGVSRPNIVHQITHCQNLSNIFTVQYLSIRFKYSGPFLNYVGS